MTSPHAPLTRIPADKGGPAAAPSALETLTKRADFQRASRAGRIAMPGFVLQMRARRDDTSGIRIGYTCSRKVGNAVARNRAKRRLREAARLVLTTYGCCGTDYVLIGRRDQTAALPFDQLLQDLQAALRRLHSRPE